MSKLLFYYLATVLLFFCLGFFELFYKSKAKRDFRLPNIALSSLLYGFMVGMNSKKETEKSINGFITTFKRY